MVTSGFSLKLYNSLDIAQMILCLLFLASPSPPSSSLLPPPRCDMLPCRTWVPDSKKCYLCNSKCDQVTLSLINVTSVTPNVSSLLSSTSLKPLTCWSPSHVTPTVTRLSSPQGDHYQILLI